MWHERGGLVERCLGWHIAKKMRRIALTLSSGQLGIIIYPIRT